MEATGVNLTRNFTESYSEIVESLQNKTLVVNTIYVRERKIRFLRALFLGRMNYCPALFSNGPNVR